MRFKSEIVSLPCSGLKPTSDFDTRHEHDSLIGISISLYCRFRAGKPEMKNARIRCNEAGIDPAISNTKKEIHQHTKEVAGVPQL